MDGRMADTRDLAHRPEECFLGLHWVLAILWGGFDLFELFHDIVKESRLYVTLAVADHGIEKYFHVRQRPHGLNPPPAIKCTFTQQNQRGETSCQCSGIGASLNHRTHSMVRWTPYVEAVAWKEVGRVTRGLRKGDAVFVCRANVTQAAVTATEWKGLRVLLAASLVS
ncbi:hypothetical protein BJX96DRAFT_111465 [Aspergillus floccosus]